MEHKSPSFEDLDSLMSPLALVYCMYYLTLQCLVLSRLVSSCLLSPVSSHLSSRLVSSHLISHILAPDLKGLAVP